jgi:cytochrome c553
MPSKAFVAAVAASLLAALPLQAMSETPPSRTAVCAACHGEGGRSNMANIPSLAAQPPVFVETQLIMIREGLRPVPPMQGMLDGVADAEVTALARYYSQQKIDPPKGATQAALVERGKAAAARLRCASCHLPDYSGREQMPRLAGQREEYLNTVMKQFRDNQTRGRDTIMTSTLYGVPDEDIAAMAHYMAHLPGK